MHSATRSWRLRVGRVTAGGVSAGVGSGARWPGIGGRSGGNTPVVVGAQLAGVLVTLVCGCTPRRGACMGTPHSSCRYRACMCAACGHPRIVFCLFYLRVSRNPNPGGSQGSRPRNVWPGLGHVVFASTLPGRVYNGPTAVPVGRGPPPVGGALALAHSLGFRVPHTA